MYVNIIYFILIVIYIIIAYRSNVISQVLKFLNTLIALIVAFLLHGQAAVFLTKFDYLRIDENTSIPLSVELVYYKAIGFLSMFLLSYLIFAIIVRFSEVDKKIDLGNSKIAKIIFGGITGYIHATLILALFLATPYAIDYANNLSYSLVNYSVLSFITDKVFYHYRDLYNILENVSEVETSNIEAVILNELIYDNYTSKEEVYNILKDSSFMNDELKGWLTK